MAAVGRFLSLLFLSTCVALLLQPSLGDSKKGPRPKRPGPNASIMDWIYYADELAAYNIGKRDLEETPLNFLEWGAPNKVAPRELRQTDM